MFSARSRSVSPLPPSTSTPTRGCFPTPRVLLAFLSTAAVSGVLFHVLYITLVGGGGGAFSNAPPVRPSPPIVTVVHEICPPKISPPAPRPHSQASDSPANTPPYPHIVEDEGDEWDLGRLRAMVAKTKGYYARDYSLGLGWNNVRYIIEASLLHATLLNRTLVLPSFVYARSCEWEINTCAAFATMVNRGDAIGWGEWRDLPLEKQMGWKVPMEYMLDLPHLRRQSYNVILVKDYLRLHGLSPDIEWSNGAWHRTAYHDGTNPLTTFAVIPNEEYDPKDVVRVDTIKPIPKGTTQGKYNDRLLAKLGDNAALSYAEVREVVGNRFWGEYSDEDLEKALLENGWATVHTFAGAVGMDYFKAVIEPVRQAAPISRLKGFIDDYDHINDDVLILEGETHYGRKPGAMRFTSVAERDNFAKMVIYGFRPIARVRKLGEKMAQRMRLKVDGRMWMAAHMRRGDFVSLGWAMEGSLKDHFTRIKNHLAKGRETLNDLYTSKDLRKYDIPGGHIDQSQLVAAPPLENDPFYIATDERSKDGIKFMRENGAVVANDLITLEDRQEFGWPILLTDILGLVEQYVISLGYMMYAHGLSSVAGGAANMRAARGADPRTLYVD